MDPQKYGAVAVCATVGDEQGYIIYNDLALDLYIAYCLAQIGILVTYEQLSGGQREDVRKTSGRPFDVKRQSQELAAHSTVYRGTHSFGNFFVEPTTISKLEAQRRILSLICIFLIVDDIPLLQYKHSFLKQTNKLVPEISITKLSQHATTFSPHFKPFFQHFRVWQILFSKRQFSIDRSIDSILDK